MRWEEAQGGAVTVPYESGRLKIRLWRLVEARLYDLCTSQVTPGRQGSRWLPFSLPLTLPRVSVCLFSRPCWPGLLSNAEGLGKKLYFSILQEAAHIKAYEATGI